MDLMFESVLNHESMTKNNTSKIFMRFYSALITAKIVVLFFEQ